MRKYFVIIIFTHAFFISALSQNIDSLKKALLTLRDTARIDCLTELGVQYLFKPDKDSALYCANLLYEESKKINYIHGFATACMLKSAIANHFYNDYSQMEQMAREAIKWFNVTANKKDIDIAYWQLGRALTNQSNYNDALANLKISFGLAQKAGYEGVKGMVLETMTDIYRDQGEYTKLLETQQKLIQMDRMSGDTSYYSEHEPWVMGLMYMLLEEYSTALPFWRRLFLTNGFGWSWNQMEYAELLLHSNHPDSALYYYNQFDSAKADIKDLRFFLVSKGEYYYFLKEYNTALPYFQKGLIYHQQLNDQRQIKRTLLDIAKTRAALGNNDSAISYARKGLVMSVQTKSKPHIRDSYEILYTVYRALRQTDSAFYYYQSYIAMKEAVMNDQTRGKLAAYEYEHKIELLDKEKLISDQHLKIQQQQFEQESFQKKILLGSIIALILTGVIVFRAIMFKRKNEKLQLENELRMQQLQNEKTKAEMQRQATELEMQALRSQMNPHFIFNCLSSINRFILKNEMETASDYLTKFSRLIRMVLNNSKQIFIPLEDELEMLRLYLDLERLRFKNSFDYSITFTNSIDIGNVFIPPLLLQPFAENAIWHGLMHKEGLGHLEISLSVEEKILCCIITDEGIGRIKAAMFKSKSAEKQKSMGLQITKERLALLNQDTGEQMFLHIEDITGDDGNDAGTRVILRMHYKNLIETCT